MRWICASMLLTAAAMGAVQGCTAVVVGGAAATAVVAWSNTPAISLHRRAICPSHSTTTNAGNEPPNAASDWRSAR